MSTQKLTAPVNYDQLSLDDMAELAREIASSVHGYMPVLQRKGITPKQYQTIAAHPLYREFLKQAILDFQKVESAQARSRIKAAIGFEHAIPAMAARCVDPREPLEKVAQMAKVLADAGGISSRDQSAGPQDRITISIDLGGDAKLVFDKGAATRDSTTEVRPILEGTAAEQPLAAHSEGPRNVPAIQSVPSGTGEGPTVLDVSEGPTKIPEVQTKHAYPVSSHRGKS